jgi:ribosomal protein L10
MDLTHKQTKKQVQLKTSSHEFNIETGRYGLARQSNFQNRICYQCCDVDAVEHLAKLPFFEPINKEEINVLQTCPTYEDIRATLAEDLVALSTEMNLILEAAKLMVKIDGRRFSKEPTANRPRRTK